MATASAVLPTCQQIIARAVAFSALNTPLASDPAEMLARIASVQQQVWTATTSAHRAPFRRTDPVTTTAGASGRSVAFATLAAPLERLLRVTLADGTPVSLVDALDPEADLAPRVTADPAGLREVGSDWGPPGAVSLLVTYDAGPVTIDPTGTLDQRVSVEDAWADLIVVPLALYLAKKDPGRDPAEAADLKEQITATEARWAAHCTHRLGTPAQRFALPTPADVAG